MSITALPLLDAFDDLAVIPVFVNAGAALFPALLAGLASAVSLVFKPRELFRLCRRKPQVPLIVLTVGVVVFLLVKWMASPGGGDAAETGRGGGAAPAAASGTDWSKVALELIRQEERAKALGGTVSTEPESVTPPPVVDEPLVYRGNYQRTGVIGEGSPLGLVPFWEFREQDTMILSSPLVHGDRIFCASTYLDPPGSYGAVFCLDRNTGRPIWTTELKSTQPELDFMGFFSSPALSADGKSLVIGQGLHADANAELVCLNAETGRVRWLVPTPLHVESSPAIDGDIVVVGAGAVEAGSDHKPKGDPQGIGHPGYVFAVRISDGEELWRHPVVDPESSPAIKDGVAFIGSGMNGSAVVALRIAPDIADTERLAWKVDTPFPATGSVTLSDDLVLVGCGNGDFVFAAPNPEGLVLALDQKTGETRWSVPMPDAVLGPIAVRDGVAVCPVRNGEIVALDLEAKGKQLWRQRISERAPALAGPAFTGTYVYATTTDGYLTVLDAADGKILERIYINHEEQPGELGLTFSSPLVADGRLYVGSETGGLRCFVGKETK